MNGRRHDHHLHEFTRGRYELHNDGCTNQSGGEKTIAVFDDFDAAWSAYLLISEIKL